MRRKDREVTDAEKIEEILEACGCCRIGLVDEGEAYIVPLNFGYEQTNGSFTLYFHCAREGRKMDLIPQQRSVSFEMDANHSLVEGAAGCDFSYRYQCIMGKGRMEVLEEPEEKLHGLRQIMKHYSGKEDWEFQPDTVKRVQVLRLSVAELSCKEN